MRRNLGLFLFLVFGFFAFLRGQVTTSTGQTPTNLVQNTLVGAGLQVSNVTFQGNQNTQIGTFNGTTSNLGLASGVVLSTGQINPPNGFFPNGFITGAGTPGWQPLSQYYGQIFGNALNTNNAAVLTFNFIPQGDTLKFRYVFASNEYNQFVNSSFNDIFAFFLTGPNPNGPAYNQTNVALIPNSTQPVTINTVNNGQNFACGNGPCTNCQYYVDNCNQNNGHGFGGATVPLWAVAEVVPCSTYTITLAVADIVDGALNSAVFLETGSFQSSNLQLSVANNTTSAADTILTEGCGQAQLVVTRTSGVASALTVNLNITGSATNGVDYQNIPTTINFQPGQATDTLDIIPLLDQLSEGQEIISISVQGSGCNTQTTSINFYINDYIPLTAFAGNDTVIDCNGAVLTAAVSGGKPGYQYSWDNGASTGLSYNYIPTQDRYVTFSVTDTCGNTVEDSLFVDFIEPVTAGFNLHGFQPTSVVEGCGTARLAISRSISVNQAKTYPIQITGSAVNGTDYSPIAQTISYAAGQDTVYIDVVPNYDAQNEGNETVTVTVVDTLCDGTTVPFTATVTVIDIVPLQLDAGPDQFINCPRQAKAINPIISGGRGQLSYQWAHGPQTAALSNLLPSDTTSYTITVTDSCGNSLTDEVVLFYHHNPVADFLLDGPYCEPVQMVFTNQSDPVSGTIKEYAWDLNKGQSSEVSPQKVYYAGNYTVQLIATNIFNCSDTVAKSFVVLPSPVVVPNFTPQDPSMLDPEVEFSDRSYPDIVQWNWEIEGETNSQDSSFSWYFDSPGLYQGRLEVINSEGCSAFIEFPIRVRDETSIYIPNAFTPNGDGLNDLFVAQGVNWKTYQMWIFNRWGEELYFTNDKAKGWNGAKHNVGEVLKQDTYTYKIRVVDNNNKEHTFAGKVQLFP